eukprot:CAMPEP_0174262172 /NCGR_PEP_ID=MMETSP0439-20130205/12814_1 /TAXON_ID=0 /ORGANISM="Stereomyxa ramosa, Strain Chinc5" /LENGTH=393 /DNA_ID=CAMNT_0015346829 /DNA_START=226 /DNA_END=1407 /DNA_ORIENTATION=+
MGESVPEGELAEWTKAVGDQVEVDEIVALIETDKVTMEVRSSAAGVVTELCAEVGDTIAVGDPLFKVDSDKEGSSEAPKEKKESKEEKEAPKEEEKAAPKEEKEEAPKEKKEAQKEEKKEPPKEDKKEASKEEKKEAPKQEKKETTAKADAPQKTPARESHRGESRVKLTRMRKRVAERLKGAQDTFAMLTTFQECDMSKLMEMRKDLKDDFMNKHGVKLGFMSAFVKASTVALLDQPVINAVIDENEILYRDYVDISVAVATPKGLVVPVLRNCEDLSFSDIEKKILDLGTRARNDKIEIEEMVGGTFTISNGGVYGSMMGTPIINPPQSAILGMHSIINRPVAIADKVEIRPMMYLALTYDHRLIDGREAVTFLTKVKSGIEDPRRLMLDL